jgi:hypothetical protein
LKLRVSLVVANDDEIALLEEERVDSWEERSPTP